MRNGKPIGLVVVLKDEVHDIAGWLAWHLAIGFDTIFVIDDCSTDGTEQVVTAAAQSFDVRYSKVVQDHSHFWERQQREYRRAISDLKKKFSWLCFLDSDEYLLLLEDPDVFSFLARFPDADGVAVNWCLHGNNGHVLRPLVPAPVAYPKRSGPGQKINRHVKSIVRPNRIGDHWDNVHCFDIRPEAYVDVRGETIRWSGTRGIISGTPCFEVARIMHFQNRSMEHFVDRARKRPDIPVDTQSWSEELWQDEEDTALSIFLAPMFAILTSIELAANNLVATVMAKHLRRPGSEGAIPYRSVGRSRPLISIYRIRTHHGTRLWLDSATNLIVHSADGPDGLLPLLLIRSSALPSDALLIAATGDDRPLRLLSGRQASTVIRFKIADALGDRVTLQLPETSLFLTAEPTDLAGGAKRITANRRETKDWETFSLDDAASPEPGSRIATIAEAYIAAIREDLTVEHLGDWLAAHDPDTRSRLLQTLLRQMSKGEQLRLLTRFAGAMPLELLSGSRYS